MSRIQRELIKFRTQRVSQSFCVLPWTHLYVNNSGEIHACCMAEYYGDGADSDSKKIYAYENGAIPKAWNSDYMQSIRRKMLAGQRPRECERCFTDEDHGLKSYRLSQNEIHGHHLNWSTIQESKQELNIRFLDIRLGNMCNLVCRMCHPSASRKWIPEWNQLFPDALDDQEQKTLKLDWFEDDLFWSNLNPYLEQIRSVHLAGGEPLMTKKSFEFLKTLIAKGYAKDINLTYNTNFTLLPEFAFDLWKEFNSVTLMLSIDGFDQVNKYIRYPANWDEIAKNFRKLVKYQKEPWLMKPKIVTTVQVLNAFDLVNLWKFLNDLPLELYPNFHLNLVSEPECYSVQILPKDIKDDLRKEWLSGLDMFRAKRFNSIDSFKLYLNMKKNIVGLIKYMYSESREDLIPEFVRRTRVLDKTRNESLEQIIPKLERTLNKSS